MRHRELVLELIREYDCKSVLDYGSGRGTLGNTVMGRDGHNPPAKVTWYDYDPAHPDKRVLPVNGADLVTCTHVLEHVEPELLDATIDEIAALARKAIYIAVPSLPALAVLPDGRNAHLIQEPGEWWLAKLSNHFETIKQLPDTFARSGAKRDETRFVIQTC